MTVVDWISVIGVIIAVLAVVQASLYFKKSSRDTKRVEQKEDERTKRFEQGVKHHYALQWFIPFKRIFGPKQKPVEITRRSFFRKLLGKDKDV